jgi:hypothetical protein
LLEILTPDTQNGRMPGPLLLRDVELMSVPCCRKFRWSQLAAAAMAVAAMSVCVRAQRDTPTTIPDSNSSPAWLREAPLDPGLQATVQEAVKDRQYQRAEALLLEQQNKSRSSAPLLALLGNIFFLDGQYLNCAVAMKKADALAPLGERNRFTLAMAYVALKRGAWGPGRRFRISRKSIPATPSIHTGSRAWPIMTCTWLKPWPTSKRRYSLIRT